MTDTALAEPVPIDRWDKRLSHIIDAMQGRPLNVHRLMANNPALLDSWWNFRMYAVGGCTLERRYLELVVLRVAACLGSWYEWASHVERGLDAGLTLDEIRRVHDGPANPAWPEKEALVLRAVDECLQDRAIGHGTIAKLRRFFSVAEIMDIIAVHGVYVIIGTLINTCGLELDESVALPPGISEDTWLR